MPTTEQVSTERSDVETQRGATSPYALFLSPSHRELQRAIEVTFCCFIRGNGWINTFLINTASEGSLTVVWIKGHPFALESRGLA
ncbi:hypothetical protein ABH923_000288 [Leifsonia sp. EB41]|uniref:hypothetical protein n=1 Tax=Leifsonia sp. EB41 TaxID=3156260 RepID=UPI003515C508